jgi:hypothetical protein
MATITVNRDLLTEQARAVGELLGTKPELEGVWNLLHGILDATKGKDAAVDVANARALVLGEVVEASRDCREWAAFMGGWDNACWDRLKSALESLADLEDEAAAARTKTDG